MSQKLNLDSATSGQDSDDFTTQYEPPIFLGRGTQWELTMEKANLWYSWYNISAEKGNNTFRYRNATVFRPVITIPDGQYTLGGINNVLHDAFRANSDDTIDAFGNEAFDIEITPNGATLRVNIELTSNFQLDLSLSDLYLLFGCDQVLLTHVGKADCPRVANLNDDINNLQIRCDILDGRFTYNNGVKSDSLHSFTPTTSPGTNIEITPITKIYTPISLQGNALEKIRMRIVDNQGRRINLNGEPVTYALHLRIIKERDE